MTRHCLTIDSYLMFQLPRFKLDRIPGNGEVCLALPTILDKGHQPIRIKLKRPGRSVRTEIISHDNIAARFTIQDKFQVMVSTASEDWRGRRVDILSEPTQLYGQYISQDIVTRFMIWSSFSHYYVVVLSRVGSFKTIYTRDWEYIDIDNTFKIWQSDFFFKVTVVGRWVIVSEERRSRSCFEGVSDRESNPGAWYPLVPVAVNNMLQLILRTIWKKNIIGLA